MTKEKSPAKLPAHNVTQTIDATRRDRLAHLAKTLDVPQSRVLDTLLSQCNLSDLVALVRGDSPAENDNGISDDSELLNGFVEKATAAIIRNVSVGLEAHLKESVERAAVVGVAGFFRKGAK